MTYDPMFDLLLLTWVAGAMDALSYLSAGVFTANMTGNTVVLGLAIVGPDRSRLFSCLISLSGFAAGALIAAIVLKRTVPRDEGTRDVKVGIALEFPFALVFALLSWFSPHPAVQCNPSSSQARPVPWGYRAWRCASSRLVESLRRS